jgi:hypothetical protein
MGRRAAAASTPRCPGRGVADPADSSACLEHRSASRDGTPSHNCNTGPGSSTQAATMTQRPAAKMKRPVPRGILAATGRLTARVAACIIIAGTVLLSLPLAVAQAAQMRRAPTEYGVAASAAPVLGLASLAPNGAGFGQVEPPTISYGGDPTSFVSNVHWRAWGDSRAIGHGTADWVWPGWCVACGSVTLPATVVAFGQRTCGGQPAYAYLEWFFPARGMSFNRRLASNICGDGHQPTRPATPVRCGSVAVNAPGVIASAVSITIYDSPLSCAAARSFVAGSGVGRYFNRNARFHSDGWWCGSELSMDLGGLQRVWCDHGDFTNLEFELSWTGE